VLGVRLEARTTLAHVGGHVRIMGVSLRMGVPIEGPGITLVVEAARILSAALRRRHTLLLLSSVTEPNSHNLFF